LIRKRSLHNQSEFVQLQSKTVKCEVQRERREVCVTDVPFPFSRREHRASERANERAWGEGKLGIGDGEGGEAEQKKEEKKGGGKIHFLPHPLPQLLILTQFFALPRSF